MTPLERLSAIAATRFGLRIDDGVREALVGLLERRRHAGIAPDELAARLERAEPEELRHAARALSVGETCFFRHREHFRALAEEALPALRAAAGGRRLRLLSAPCASGEEPYSIAITALRAGVTPPPEIVACDMNPELLARARAARYGRWSLREITPVEESEWFAREGGERRLRDPVPSLVRFEERNLLLDDPDFWLDGAFDAIFCRNLLIYLREEAAAALVARFARALAPGGFLFLAPAETLRGLSRDFHLVASGECFYYRSRGGEPAAAAAPAPEAHWHEAIERSARAVAGLASPAPRAAPDVLPARAEVLELVRRERFAEAGARLDALSAGAAAELLPLRAAVRLAQGRFAEAEADCEAILARDELDAGARFVRALCCAQRGDDAAALRWARAAAYLDSAFAMPHLHAGVLARRLGERELARRELALALELLPREDAGRLALYGGGFSRDHLMALCRGELAAIGGAT